MATDILGICCSCSNLAKYTCNSCGMLYCEAHFDKSVYMCTNCSKKRN